MPAKTIYPPFQAQERDEKNVKLYKKVLLWVAVQMVVTTAALLFIGPLIPASWGLGIAVAAVIALLLSALSRKTPVASNIMAILVPVILGTALYHLFNVLSSGLGNIVLASAAGTGVVFVTMSVLAWGSNKSLKKLSEPLFAVVLGLIAVFLLGIFVLHLSLIPLLVSAVSVALFTIFIFIDMRVIREAKGDESASFFALGVYLDMFV